MLTPTTPCPVLTVRLPRTCAFGMLWAAALGTLLSCGARSSQLESTNTGNPPVIDQRDIRVEVTADGIRVVGTAGAVPEGARVAVDNRNNHVNQQTTASKDGSFSATLLGKPEDQLVVSIRSKEGTSSVVLGSDEGSCHPSEASSASGLERCDELLSESECRDRDVLAFAARDCETTEDCVATHEATHCAGGCPGSVAISKSAAADVGEAREGVSSELCQEFHDLGCPVDLALCAEPPPSEPQCVAGQCQAVSGCEVGEREIRRRVELAAPTLAEGCTQNSECQVLAAAQCDYICPTNVYVAAVHQAEYEALRAELDWVCTASEAAEGEMCSIPGCAGPVPVVSVCDAGMCVPLDQEDLEAEIAQELERLNHCEVVTDCEAVSYPECSTSYIGAGQDRSELDRLLAQYGGGACDPSCPCGILECKDQICIASPSDCMTAPEGAVMTCL